MLEGIIRESTEKAYTKKLKKDGYLIANIYGKNIENVNCAFKKNEFIKAARSKTELALSVKVGDKEYKVVIQEYQKNPITNDLTHVDLLVAQDDVKNYFLIPIETVGTPKGLKNKGVLIYHRRRVKVKCLGKDLPSKYTLNVSDLDVGDNILMRDLELGENVESFLNSSIPLVGIVKAK